MFSEEAKCSSFLYIHVDLNRFSSICPCFETATRYLVYKTLKISETYSQYHFFYEKNANKTYKIDLNGLDDLVRMLSLDYSHITKKIRQILAYIIYGTYRVDSTVGDFNIDDISNGTKEVLNKNLKDVQYGKCGIHLTFDDLVPPPIFDVKIQLSDMMSSAPVLFETLSSGERQQVYSISAFLYHLTNLESVWQDSNNCRIVYQHINVVFEEIELYFHPELQRTYIKNILDGIKQINIPHIKSINMCFVTHSPFILSDIPNRNILALKNDDDNNFIENRLSTFGANIHDMLKNSFFLENGPMGAYADYVIREIISEMDRAKEGESHSSATIIHDKIILIDEPIVRMALLDEYHRIFPHENVQERIDELKVQIKELENRL